MLVIVEARQTLEASIRMYKREVSGILIPLTPRIEKGRDRGYQAFVDWLYQHIPGQENLVKKIKELESQDLRQGVFTKLYEPVNREPTYIWTTPPENLEYFAWPKGVLHPNEGLVLIKAFGMDDGLIKKPSHVAAILGIEPPNVLSALDNARMGFLPYPWCSDRSQSVGVLEELIHKESNLSLPERQLVAAM